MSWTHTEAESVWGEVVAERARQDAKWGGRAHDSHHTAHDWIAFIAKHAGAAVDGRNFREQMVRVAALAVAAIESYDERP